MNVSGAARAGTSWDQVERMLAPAVSVGSLTEFLIWSRPRAAGPFAGLVAAVWLLCGHGVGFAEAGLAVLFYLLTGSQ
jgi:hypothetical protein